MEISANSANEREILSANAYPFPWQSVVEITTTVTNRYDELDEVVCELAPPLTNCSLGNGLISQVG